MEHEAENSIMLSSRLSPSSFFGILCETDTADRAHHDEENDKIGSISSEGMVTHSTTGNLSSFLNRFMAVSDLWPLSISASEQKVETYPSQDNDEIFLAAWNHPSSAPSNNEEDSIDFSENVDSEVPCINHFSLALNSSMEDSSWEFNEVRIPVNIVKSTPPPDTDSWIISSNSTVASTTTIKSHGSEERTSLSPPDEDAANVDCCQISSEQHKDLSTTIEACQKQLNMQDRSIYANAGDLGHSSPTCEGQYTSKAIQPRTLQMRHLSWFGHGKITTLIPIALAMMALMLSIFSRLSLHFVSLSEPLYVSAYFMKVEAVGLNRIRLCYNDSVIDGRMLTIIDDYDMAATSTTTVPMNKSRSSKVLGTGCYVLDLTTENVDDNMWNVSRCCISFAIYLGTFLTIMLGTSICWQSINLKPIAVGLLIVYFFQSVSFFFFDSNLCREHICRLSAGSFASILSCILWFASGLACIRMDIIHQSKLRRYKHTQWHESKLQRSRETESTADTDIETPLSTPI